jgi:hypothetical protein
VGSPSGKKAELDKDGIAFDISKAELDKDGISFSDDSGAEEEITGDSPEDAAQAAPKQGKTARRRIILLASIFSGLALVFLIAGITAYHFLKKPAVEIPVVYQKPPAPPRLYSPEGEIILDPIMVTYNSRNPKESGVLLAQLSMHVNPEIAYNIGSRMFDIRNLVSQRLSANAEVYSKDELAAMIRDDLKSLNVRDVAFVQFEKR